MRRDFTPARQWVVLPADRRINGGAASTKARTNGEAAHPLYEALGRAIAAYQTHVLQHYRGTKTGSVAEYYERSRRLMHADDPALLLPGAVLVEGRLIGDLPPGSTLSADAIEFGGSDEDDEERRYARLHGTLGSTEVIGVPDVVTYDAEVDVWRVADYKTAKMHLSGAELRDDAHLHLYLHLFEHAGIVSPDARMLIGHIYLNDEVQTVWVARSDLLRIVRPRLMRQVDLLARQIERSEFVPVRGILNGWSDRCSDCLLAQACRA